MCRDSGDVDLDLDLDFAGGGSGTAMFTLLANLADFVTSTLEPD